MTLILYGPFGSPTMRASVMTVKALGIDVEFEQVNTLAGDHLKPEYLKLNPLHTVPTLRDGDFVIWDSHAINAYLVGKYGKDDSLYPKDLQKRAVVDQRMYFDTEVLFTRFKSNVALLIFKNVKINKDMVADFENAYNSLETLLERSTYVAGEQVTIADFSIVTTLTSANVLVPVASNRFPKISEWLVKMQALPYYASANQVGLDQFAAVVKSKLA
ncbi:glutathione S-transferase 1 isoform X4 [Anoplophora glabripennis]|uniref:glutathione S-transferase 1 isoform X4 n=1 Tax=Anoplophora glabripennis TaxID=217634 RepID=UPI0008734D8E|nr:glutathione S-transferase 1 isoform X4 [Anoplophora glabripennis]